MSAGVITGKPPGGQVADDDAGASDPVGDPEHWATGRLLSTAARLVEHAWDAHLATWGLNHASFAVLWMLERGPLPQRSLAASASVQDQTMSRIVERLQRLGYVERARGTDDRRQVLVSITAQGRRVRGLAQDERLAEALVTDAVPDPTALRRDLLALVRLLSPRRGGPA